MKTLLALIALIFCGCAPFFLQKNIERDIGDKRVLLQGFYWESYRHGHPDRFPDYGPASWYTLLAEQAPVIRDGRFDLIWHRRPATLAISAPVITQRFGTDSTIATAAKKST